MLKNTDFILGLKRYFYYKNYVEDMAPKVKDDLIYTSFFDYSIYFSM